MRSQIYKTFASLALLGVLPVAAMAKPIKTQPALCTPKMIEENNLRINLRLDFIRSFLEFAETSAKKTVDCKKYINQRWPDKYNQPNLQDAWQTISLPHAESMEQSDDAIRVYRQACVDSGLSYESGLADLSGWPFNYPVHFAQSCSSYASLLTVPAERSSEACSYRRTGQTKCEQTLGFFAGNTPVGSKNIALRSDTYYIGLSSLPNVVQVGGNHIRVEDFACNVQAHQTLLSFENAEEVINLQPNVSCADPSLRQQLQEAQEGGRNKLRELQDTYNQPDEAWYTSRDPNCLPEGYRVIRNGFTSYTYPRNECLPPL